jgi:hypothetical protein
MVEISWTPRPPLSPLPDDDEEAEDDDDEAADDDDDAAPPMPRIANMPDRSNRCCVINRRSRNMCARVSTVPCRLYAGLGSTLYVFVRSSNTTLGLLNASNSCVLSCAKSSSDDDRYATTDEITSSSITDDAICRLSIRSLISSKMSANDPSPSSSRTNTLANARHASALNPNPRPLNARKIVRSIGEVVSKIEEAIISKKNEMAR